ncbi:MAG: hypothetical protein LQ352_001253 [Teloschistes flavicans]|nr:MAG: hypothetical protein LQ352_001253 [Teloschistes flavicans]
MSSFFTTPASQKKRKRQDTSAAPPSKRQRNTIDGSNALKTTKSKPARAARDDSISGSGSEGDEDRGKASAQDAESSSDSGSEEETGAQRRLRLAEQYLENIKGGVETVGFDAEEIDRDLIAERLKEDVAATKGKSYRHITSSLNFSPASKTAFRADTQTTTSIAVCPPYIYTVSKDMSLIKWELPTPTLPSQTQLETKKKKKKKKKKKEKKEPPKQPAPPIRRRPTKLLYIRGNKNETHNSKYEHHTAPILTVAASEDGKYVATGGADKRLIIWSASDLKPLRIFTQHRDAVTGLAFRKGTNQLYSSSKDRTIKIWSLDELGYMETLFGHQDEVVDVAALAMERCVSVGARDRTARLWKVVEESQLVFRGGGGGGGASEKRRHDAQKENGLTNGEPRISSYVEGSIDRVAMIDEETFITGSDNGGISLWSLHKKKPVFTVPTAHGLDPPLTPEEASAEAEPDPKVSGEPQPRWITALATVPYSDMILSGSWDGWVRVWRVSGDKKRIEEVGVLGSNGEHQEKSVNGSDGVIETGGTQDNAEERAAVTGVVNDIEVFERGDRGKDGLCVVVATGKEHRFGRWKTVKGRNGAVVFEVTKKVPEVPKSNGATLNGNTSEMAIES